MKSHNHYGLCPECERLRADDIEILTGDIRRRDAMLASLRAAATTIVEKWNVGRFPHREEWDALRRALSAPAAPKAPEPCDDCDGTGWLTFSDGTRAKCMACSGRGVTADGEGA